MDRTKRNFLIDGLSLAAFVFLTATGFMMEYLLPAGSGGGGHREAITVWGLSRHQWGSVHYWVAVVLLALMALHLAFHWRWIVSVVKGKRDRRNGLRLAIGVFGLIGLLALAFAPFVSGPQAVESQPVQQELDIRGSMTLAEVEDFTGVPLSYIVQELGLPDNIDGNARLGQLRREYGFEMNRIRNIVDQYSEETVNP